MMEDTLISFETAKLAKEKKFNIPCENFYIEYIDDDVADLFNYEEQRGSGYAELYRNNQEFKYSAPTQSLLQKWLREIHKIIVLVDWEGTDGYFYKLDFKSFYEVAGNNNKNYEDCLELGLQEALKLI